MMQRLLLGLALGIAGCSPPGTPAAKNPEDVSSMLVDSPWTWMYLFDGQDQTAVTSLFSGRPHSIWQYQVREVNAICDYPGVTVEIGSTLIRVEAKTIWPATGPRPRFQGVVRHHDYTSGSDRDSLAGSRAPLEAFPETVAVLIPVRKSAAWWALPADARAAHFQAQPGKLGHTAIGATYRDRIYRKLYHTRYAVETTDHDFLTYFEFEKGQEPAFDGLLAKLRDPDINPEWKYVDREYEIRMTRTK